MSAEAFSSHTNWRGLRLSTGFYLSEMVRGVIELTDTDERRAAVQAVLDLFERDCKDAGEFDAAARKLGELVDAHPDAIQESGTWHTGNACLLAMASAMEAAVSAKWHLYGRDEYRVDAAAYKALKYVLRAYTFTSDPTQAVSCLRYIERLLNLPPAHQMSS